MAKRQFYIIGHNPNSVEDAIAYLKAGANALEPDIQVNNDGEYYVAHGDVNFSPLLLKDYLAGVGKFIQTYKRLIPKSNPKRFWRPTLALIAFDTKDDLDNIDSVHNINQFLKVVDENFARKFTKAKGVALLVTSSSQDGFLRKYNQKVAMAGIGVDADNDAAGVLKFFKKKPRQHKIAYADGISVSVPGPNVYHSVSEAKYLQAKGAGKNFKLVYTWTMAREYTIRNFLNLHVDGMIVNVGTVKTLRDILAEKKATYQLAKNGHNPWAAAPIPAYALTIKTRDQNWAGTDQYLTIKLSGKKGSVSTKLDTSYVGMMEGGDINHCTLEGKDLGALSSLRLDGDGWLPQWIKVLDCQTMKSTTFHYTEDDWVMGGTPVVKKV